MAEVVDGYEFWKADHTALVHVLWHWWRRRRQGKPSRVLGLVRDLGHRLTVVHVPAKEGA